MTLGTKTDGQENGQKFWRPKCDQFTTSMYLATRSYDLATMAT